MFGGLVIFGDVPEALVDEFWGQIVCPAGGGEIIVHLIGSSGGHSREFLLWNGNIQSVLYQDIIFIFDFWEGQAFVWERAIAVVVEHWFWKNSARLFLILQLVQMTFF